MIGTAIPERLFIVVTWSESHSMFVVGDE